MREEFGSKQCQGTCQSLGEGKWGLRASITEHGEPVGKAALTESGSRAWKSDVCTKGH